jgi:hypothetical protein
MMDYVVLNMYNVYLGQEEVAAVFHPHQVLH